MKRIYFLIGCILFFICTESATAQTFVVNNADGIPLCYKVILAEKEVELAYDVKNSQTYIGILKIPNSVSYEGEEAVSKARQPLFITVPLYPIKL